MRIAETISSFLTGINLFKVPIRLKIQERDFYSSRAGELFSFCIYIYLIYGLATSDVFYKLSPKVVQQDIENLIAPWYNFTEENFLFAAEITDVNGIGVPPDPTMYKVVMNFLTVGTNQTTGVQTIVDYEIFPMILCKNATLSKESVEILQTFPYGLCLPNPRFQIGGAAGTTLFRTVEISLQMCTNDTTNNTCQNQSTIDAFFVNKKIAYIISDHNFATNNYEEPVVPKITAQYFALDSKISKKQRIYLQPITISSDDGYVTSSTSIIKSWSVGTVLNDFDLNSQIDLFNITIFSTTLETQIFRYYMKIQDALSGLGGIVNVLLLIGTLLMKFIPYAGFQVYLSKHLFTYRNLKANSNTEETQKTEALKFVKTETTQMKNSDTKRNLITVVKKVPSHTDFEILQSPKSQQELSSPIELKTISKKNHPKEELSKPMESISMQEIHPKIQPSRGDEQHLTEEPEGYNNPIEMEDENKKNATENVINNEEMLKSFHRKVTGFSSPKKHTFVKSLTMQKKEQSLAENFKNYSEMKAKGDVLTLGFTDLFADHSKIGFRKKMKALSIATSKINSDLDIANMMQKFQEIDKLKLILFNKEQLMLFNLIAKPEIFVDEKMVSENDPGIMISQNLKHLHERSDQNFLDLVIYYNKITKKEGDDDLDGRLIKLIDKDMKKYFEMKDF